MTWLDVEEAARRLGVKPATLYAYVSRGQLRRRRTDDRRSEYHAGDVAALAVRGRRARPTRPSDVVVPTAVTEITPRGPRYRGHLAVDLAGTATFEAVAHLLWQVEPDRATPGTSGPAAGDDPRTTTPWWSADAAVVAAARAAVRSAPDATEPVALVPTVVATARTADPLRGELTPPAVAGTARGLISILASITQDGVDRAGSVADRLAIGCGRADRAAAAAIDAALVLLADHELAASTLAVRVAASARCDPYAGVLAGTAVLSGARHGGASRPLERVLQQVGAGREPAEALAAEVVREDGRPGFGHHLYPDGDPRAQRLLEVVLGGELGSVGRPLELVLATAARRGFGPPDVDAALAGLTYALGAPVGTGELFFTVARTAGWVAHALEQYADPQLLRPRAVYTGG